MEIDYGRGIITRGLALRILQARLLETLGGKEPRSRQTYADAIVHITDFFRIAGFPEKVSIELLSLVRALDELNHGTVSQYLKPAKAFNKHVDSGATWHARAYVAIAVQILIEEGAGQSAAAKAIARQFPRLRALLSPGSRGDLGDVVLGWHKRLLAKKVSAIEAQIAWAERGKLVEHVTLVFEQRSGRKPSADESAEAIAKDAIAYAQKEAPAETMPAQHETRMHVRKPLKKG